MTDGQFVAGYFTAGIATSAAVCFTFEMDDVWDASWQVWAMLCVLAWPVALVLGALTFVQRAGSSRRHARIVERKRQRALAIDAEKELNREGFYGEEAQKRQAECDSQRYQPGALYMHDLIALPPEE